ncbi:crotonase/enoyl-CoA hydratase family protein [Roseivirga misakiensis]|uniref:Enoyl-CoA hydratase n=1 Tax=Roseivirga misakiensis TaxID=1563681 RepID=A0A1E5T0S6_9BACT|nr:crotonase/enoyl-CoA hydratase family protein [Roseivirga misakiensis]OEK04980.1 enoyl-CoA hydratase [Roseivirga misakiensis]
MAYQHFKVEITEKVAQVKFNRPEKANSLHMEAWKEMQRIFEHLSTDDTVRVIVLAGEGKHFSAGIDLELLMSVNSFKKISCGAKRSEKIRHFILELQDTITAIEKCAKPVLAAIHGGCIGGAVDIVSACDMRYSSADAYFSIKEIDLGMVADIGTLQRLPKIISPAIVSEMAYTGRKVSGAEAEKIGLVNRCFDSSEALMEGVLEVANTIASKSPLSIRGTKEMIRFTRDHSVEDSLNYIATWNAAMLLSEDLNEAFKATMEKRAPEFKD